jgi:AcrR family transcriptional regulator
MLEIERTVRMCAAEEQTAPSSSIWNKSLDFVQETAMPDRKPDRRIARSRGLILDAFGSLMLERGYERMTVQHVLDRAGVGRATFYAHFSNKEELLESSTERLRVWLRSAWRADIARGCADVPLGFSLAFFRHIDSHRRIYDLTVGRPSEVTIHRFFGQMLCDLVREDLLGKTGSRRTAKQTETSVQFLVGALWSLAVWWLSTRSTIRADDLDAQFHRLADPSVERFLAA